MYHEGLNQTVNRVFDESCRRWGTRTALVEGERRWSYLELRREIARLTLGLREAGVTTQDRVAFLVGVTSDWVILFYSLMRIGAVAVPLNLTWQGREIREGLILTQATVLVATEGFRDADYVARTLAAIDARPDDDATPGAVSSEALPHLRLLVSVEGSEQHAGLSTSLTELKARGEQATAEDFFTASEEVVPSTHSVYLLTSGTSSFPKPVIHDHQSLMVGVANYADGVEATADDSTLIIAPNYHVAAYFTVLMLHLRGGCVHVMPHFVPRAALETIERARISLLFGFDVHFLMLKRDPMFGLHDFSSITRTMIGADLHREHGVDVRCGVGLRQLRTAGGRVDAVELEDGALVPADVVLVAIGGAPAVDWLRGAAVPLGGAKPEEGAGGVLCAAGGQAVEGVYAAGDVAAWCTPDGDAYLRVEHRLNATEQGRAVAKSILDPAFRYVPAVPYFWSDQYDLKIQSFGLPSPDDEFVVVEGSLAERRFVGAYLRAGVVTGALGAGLPRELRAWRTRVGGPMPRSSS